MHSLLYEVPLSPLLLLLQQSCPAAADERPGGAADERTAGAELAAVAEKSLLHTFGFAVSRSWCAWGSKKGLLRVPSHLDMKANQFWNPKQTKFDILQNQMWKY